MAHGTWHGITEIKTLHEPFSVTSGEQSDLHTTWHLKSALLPGLQSFWVLDPNPEWEKRKTLLNMGFAVQSAKLYVELLLHRIWVDIDWSFVFICAKLC